MRLGLRGLAPPTEALSSAVLLPSAQQREIRGVRKGPVPRKGEDVAHTALDWEH